MRPLTSMLIKILEEEDIYQNIKVEPSIIDALKELASENKVLLGLLRALGINSPLRMSKKEFLEGRLKPLE